MNSKKYWSSPGRSFEFIDRMSFRMRLITAFVVLIISSASATIMIGNTVFGNKVDELARSKAAVDLRAAEQIFNSKVEKLRLLTMIASVENGFGNASLCRLFLDEVPSGVSMFMGDSVTAVRVFRRDSGPGSEKDSDELCGILSGNDLLSMDSDGTAVSIGDGVPGEGGRGIRRNVSSTRTSNSKVFDSSLAGMLETARMKGSAVSSIIVLDRRDLELLNFDGSFDSELFVFSASPLDDGRMFIVGYSLDRNDNMVSLIQNEIAVDKEAVSSVTIFMGTTRIATTMGEGLIGTAVDSVAGNLVLRYGQYHVGLTKILEENYYSAYCPLRDHSGRVVGMLGIGTPERLHADVRRRTNTLFTSLIVGGMTFGFIMTYVFSSFLMKPFSILTMGVERVAEGDLNYKVQIKTADELGRLAKSFNMMVRAVKERDLALREMTEKKLSSVEKQVSIGRLAAGIAHEINNPLTAVLTLSRLMLKHMDKNDPRTEDLGMIVEETGRCRDIVRNLLDFARENKPQKEVVDINGVLRDTLILAGKYDAMTDTLIDLKLSSGPLETAVDTGQMQQVFTNLLLNAAEAMEGGKGRITISTGEDSSGGFISIAFVDNGKGISSEQLETVFEPFYTSKEKGTGLGLSVSLGIVRSHKGTIEIQSEPGVGTTVTVILPKTEDDSNVI